MLLKSITRSNNPIVKMPSRSFFWKKKEVYLERFKISDGLGGESLGGFSRLTRNFP